MSAFFIFILGIIVRISAMIILKDVTLTPVWEYDEIAKNLISGAGFTCTYFGIRYYSLTAPLYPLLNAVVYLISNSNYYAMLFVQIMLSSAIPVVIFKITRMLYDKRVATLAAVLAVIHPGLVVFSTKTLHALTLDALLISVMVMLFIKIRNLPTVFNQIICGLFSGLCVLARPTVISFITLSLIWLYSVLGLTLWKKVICLVTIFFVSMATISPWLVRNYLIHRQIVFQTTTGYLFWLGNSEKAVGSATLSNGATMRDMMNPDFITKIYSLGTEIEQSNAFWGEALSFIYKHPVSFFILFFKKIFYFWWFSPSAGINYPHHFFVIYKIYYIFIITFCLLGMYIASTKGKGILKDGILLLLLLFIPISLSQALFYVDGRHRWEIESLFMLPVSGAIFYLFSQRIKIRCKTR